MSLRTYNSKPLMACLFYVLTIWIATIDRVSAIPPKAQPSLDLTHDKDLDTTKNVQRDLAMSGFYPTEYGCIGAEYKKSVVVNYSYSIETTRYSDQDTSMTKYIDNIVQNHEGELLIKLSEDLLSCDGANNLGLVEISSLPKDRVLRRCTSINGDCTVMHGFLTIYVDGDEDQLSRAREAALSAINDAMSDNYFTDMNIATKSKAKPLVENLLKDTYRGPALGSQMGLRGIDNHIIQDTLPDMTGTSSSSSLGMLMIILVSSVVTLFAVFALTRKINHRNKQASMSSSAHSDDLSMEDDFIESHCRSLSSLPVLPLSPEDHNLFSDESEEEEDDEDMEVLNYDLVNGGLSTISDNTWDYTNHGNDHHVRTFDKSTIRMRQT